MSFKGIITKGEYDRGITLNAKVVSPNKKYSAKTNFPVVIKANVLSDKEKCLIALNEHKASILSLGADLNDLTYDITDKLIEADSFGYKTITTYSVSNTLSAYLSSTGVVLKRPKYGSSDVNGTIAITTTLNETSITTHVPITIKSVTAEDILNSDKLSKSNLWDLISNGQSTDQVYKNLSLVSQIALNDISDTPVSVAWTVTDTAIGIMNSYTDDTIGISGSNYNKRISDSGAITMIPYPIAYGCQASLSLADIPVTPNYGTVSSQLRSFSIGGITLRAQLSIEGVDTVIVREFAPKVRTQLLTASDVFTALNATNSKIFQFGVMGTNVFDQTYPVNSNASSPYNINIDSTMESTLTFKVQSNGDNIPVERYGLDNVISLFHNTTPKILTGNVNPSNNSQEYADAHAGVFSTVTNDPASNKYVFTLNCAALKAIVDGGGTNAGKFTVALSYATTGYPIDGTNTSASGGLGTQSASAYICFNVEFTN